MLQFNIIVLTLFSNFGFFQLIAVAAWAWTVSENGAKVLSIRDVVEVVYILIPNGYINLTCHGFYKNS